ncbi:DUF6098 family protein [Microbispora siamensis]
MRVLGREPVVHRHHHAADVAHVGAGPGVVRLRAPEHHAACGPDHEPLIDQVEPVAWLDGSVVEQAREHYEKVFDAGRDSTG